MPQAEEIGLTQRSAAATRKLGSRSMAFAKDGATWALILKILLVSLLRRFQPKAVTSFELLCLAVPLPDAMARWMVSLSMTARPAHRHVSCCTLPCSSSCSLSILVIYAAQQEELCLKRGCALQNRSPLSDSFPAGSQAAAKDLADFAAPLILARVLRAAARLVRPERKPKGIRRSISESGETMLLHLQKMLGHSVWQRSRWHKKSDFILSGPGVIM